VALTVVSESLAARGNGAGTGRVPATTRRCSPRTAALRPRPCARSRGSSCRSCSRLAQSREPTSNAGYGVATIGVSRPATSPP